MVRVKSCKEYEVWCNSCQKIIVFDSPEDLRKDTKLNSMYETQYRVKCPSCGRVIVFSKVSGFDLPYDFTKEVKEMEEIEEPEKSEDDELVEKEDFVGTIIMCMDMF